jgi:hypothetical protein
MAKHKIAPLGAIARKHLDRYEIASSRGEEPWRNERIYARRRRREEPTERLLIDKLLDPGWVHVEIRIDLLNIFLVFQRIDQAKQLLRNIFVRHFNCR